MASRKARALRLEQRHMLQLKETHKTAHLSVYATSPKREQQRDVVEARKQGDNGNNVGERKKGCKEEEETVVFFAAPPAAGPWQWFSNPLGPSTSVSQCRVKLALFHVGLATKRSIFARGPSHLSLGSRHEQRAAPSVGGGGGGSDAWQGWDE